MSNLATLNRKGRAKGIPNKFNASIKEMIERALTKAGGVEYLTEQAHKNPVAFMALVARVLPLQLANADGQKLLVDFRWADTPPSAPTIEATAVDTDNRIDGEVADETDKDAVAVTFIGEC